MKKIEYLGLDFGSSKTCLIGKIQGEDTYAVFRADDQKLSFQSAISVNKKNKNLKFFNYVFDRFEDGDTVYTNLKESLLIPFFSREELNHCQDYLSKIFDRAFKGTNAEKYDFSELKAVYYGRPSFFNPRQLISYENRLQGILEEIFNKAPDNVKKPAFYGLPEPILAAQAYLKATANTINNPIKAGDTLLVLDFGGYTLDIALVVVGNDKTTIVNASNHGSFSSEEAASKKKKTEDTAALSPYPLSLGKAITLELCSLLFSDNKLHWDVGVDNAKCELFENPFDVKTSVLGVLATQNGGKFTLAYNASNSSSAENVITFKGGKKNIAIDKSYSNFFSHIEAFLKTIHLGEHSISHVLFVGGTANMLPLREAITESLAYENWMKDQYSALFIEVKDCWKDTIGTHNDLSSECAVALGACIAAEKGLTPSLIAKTSLDNSTTQEDINQLKEKIKTLEKKNDLLKKDNTLLNSMYKNAKAHLHANQKSTSES